MFADERLLRRAHRKLRQAQVRQWCRAHSVENRFRLRQRPQTHKGDPMRKIWMVAAGGLMFAAFAAGAQEYRLGTLTAEHPWSRPTAGPNKLGAAYLTLKNAGQNADTLQSASSPDAERVEIHEHTQDAGGVMKMRPVEGG